MCNIFMYHMGPSMRYVVNWSTLYSFSLSDQSIYLWLFILGTNFGMKNHSAALKPTHGMDVSTQTLNLQSDIKAAELNELIFRDYSETDKKVVQYTYISAYYYFWRRSCKGSVWSIPLVWTHENRANNFQVAYVGGQDEADKSPVDLSEEDSFMCVPLPRFECKREVTMDKNGIMYCNCKIYECWGIFCEQQVSIDHEIYRQSGQEFLGFTHHDVATRYRSAYMHLAYKAKTLS